MRNLVQIHAIALAIAACGSGSSDTETTANDTPTTIGGPTTTVGTERPAPDPWVAMDEHGLPVYVEARARERLAEVQPGFDLSRLDAYRADPTTAPEISGRAVERLFDLAAVDIAAGRLDAAKGTIALIRARAKNRNSAFSGSTFLAEIARRQAGEDADAQRDAIAAVFRALPQNRFGAATVVFQLFQAQEQLTANIEQAKQQMLSLESASGVLFFSQILPDVVAHRDTFLAAIDVVRQEHEHGRPPREYRFSTVDLAHARDAQPVVVAVWDVGTNPALFEDQLFVNEGEQANGADDDENGQIDDINGLVADGAAPNTRLFYEPPPATLQQFKPFLRGIMDLRAGMASTEAAHAVLELERGATNAAALDALEQNLDAVGEWAHGSHVAGILLAGNPAAKLAIFRSAWAGEARPYHHRGPTDEELAAEQANVEAVAAFIERNHVRVVNASLGFAQDYVEDQLRYETDRYHTDAEVRARAAEVQAHRAASWRYVFEHCPSTLFVVAAGNSNRDVVEYGDVPASLDMPNVLAVGAVDRFGQWATFTSSSPERVRIFDHGVEVESVIPDGDRVPLSGTSMASPNVANLAGKMVAVSPGLTPEQLIDIIVDSGDPIPAPFDGRIANEQRAITRARLMARRATHH